MSYLWIQVMEALAVARTETAILRICIIIAVMACGISAGYVQATPPDIIEIEDTPLAANATTLFVERHTYDNMGSHYDSRTEKFLVAIDIDSGKEEIWPIYGARKTTEFDAASGEERYNVTHVDPSQNWVNPYAIMAKAKAFPTDRWLQNNRPRLPQPVIVGDQVTIKYDHNQSFIFSFADAMKRLEQTMATMPEIVVDAKRLSTNSTRMLYADWFIENETCKFSTEGWPVSRIETTIQIVRLTCGDDDNYIGSASILLPIREHKANL